MSRKRLLRVTRIVKGGEGKKEKGRCRKGRESNEDREL